MGSCNCGHLAQTVTRLTKAEIHTQALQRYGEPVVDTLRTVLLEEREARTIRRQVPRILEKIGTPRCLAVLLEGLEVQEPDTRRACAVAAARVRERADAGAAAFLRAYIA